VIVLGRRLSRGSYARSMFLAAAMSCACAKTAAEAPPQPPSAAQPIASPMTPVVSDPPSDLDEPSPTKPEPETREVAATDTPARRKGSLKKEDIRRAINRNINAVRACFESAVVRNPDCENKIIVRFEIDRRGRVASVKQLGQSRADRQHVRCVLDAVKAMKFPAPEGGYVIVTYPFMVHWTGF
jgi:hypothetical protein